MLVTTTHVAEIPNMKFQYLETSLAHYWLPGHCFPMLQGLQVGFHQFLVSTLSTEPVSAWYGKSHDQQGF